MIYIGIAIGIAVSIVANRFWHSEFGRLLRWGTPWEGF